MITTLKTCFKCGAERPFTDFYRHPMMGDGRLGKCKECTKKDVHENYFERREQYAAYEKERFQRPARKAAAVAYARDRDPIIKKAHGRTSYALRTGKLIREPCEVCGTTTRIEAHHDDYTKPLALRWLCRRHHLEHHGKLAYEF